jgi:hypothetical protein
MVWVDPQQKEPQLSHLLKSVNPEAVERIEDPTMDAPDIGTMVVYIPRNGIQRMGRREFPAIVLGNDQDGYLDLFVLMEPEDMMLESHVRPQLSDEGHSWRYPEQPPLDEETESRLSSLQAENKTLSETVEVLQAQIADLRKIVIGDYNPADLSVYSLLHEFESKLNG